MKVKSKDLYGVGNQRELELFRQPEPNSLPVELIRKFPTPGKAFTAACDSSGLPDQVIYEFVGIDAGTFSKMKKGLATLQGDDLQKFCYAVNNKIFPEWLAYQVGCTLVEIKSEAERRAEALEKQLAEERLKNRVLVEALHGKVAA